MAAKSGTTRYRLACRHVSRETERTESRRLSQLEGALGKQEPRNWIANAEAAGEPQHVMDADRDEELGGIVDFVRHSTGSPADTFDDMPGYAKGQFVFASTRAKSALMPPRGH